MNRLPLLLASLLVASSASAGSTYDWQTGNMYQTNTNPYSGQTTVHGSNLQNGTNWNTTIDRNGNQHGTDSNYNQWNYNAQSKTYMNYGTGTICTGTGNNRICN